MFTLQDIFAAPQFKEADLEGKKRIVDQSFSKDTFVKDDPDTINGPNVVKTFLDLQDRFSNETDFQKDFVQREFGVFKDYVEGLNGLRSQAQAVADTRVAQGFNPQLVQSVLNGEDVTIEDPALQPAFEVLQNERRALAEQQQGVINRFAASSLRIAQDARGEAQDEDEISQLARGFLTQDPGLNEEFREEGNTGLLGGIKEAAADVTDVVLDEVRSVRTGESRITDIRKSGDRRNAFQDRIKESFDLSDLSFEEERQFGDEIIGQEREVQRRERDQAFPTNRRGEISPSSRTLARFSDEEISQQIEASDAAPAAKTRFLKQLPRLKKAAAEELGQTLRSAVVLGDITIPEQLGGLSDQGRKDRTLEDVNTLITGGGRATDEITDESIFTDPEKVQAFIKDIEENQSGFLIASGSKLSASFESTLGGLVSGGLSLAGRNGAATEVAKAVQSRQDARGAIDEVRNNSAGVEFASDLSGTALDLVIARFGGKGGASVAKLFGAKEGSKRVAQASLAGVAAGSGVSAGLSTFNEALSKDLGASEAFGLGLKSFLITGGVTLAGGASQGVDALLAGSLKVGARNDLKNYISTVLVGAANDGVEEFADSVLSAVEVQKTLNPQLSHEDHVEGALHALALGAALGGGLPGAVKALPTAAETISNFNAGRSPDIPTAELKKAADIKIGELSDQTEGNATAEAINKQIVQARIEAGQNPVEAIQESGRLEEPTGEEAPTLEDLSPDEQQEVVGRINSLTERATFANASVEEQDAIQIRITDALIKNPRLPDGEVLKRATQAVSDVRKVQKNEANARAQGNIESITDEAGNARDFASGEADASQTLESQEEVGAVQNLVNQLPTAQREALELKGQGFTNTEIADQLGIKPNAVSKRIKQAQSGLRQQLRGNPPAPAAPAPEARAPEGSDAEVFRKAIEAARQDPKARIREAAETLELVENPSEAIRETAALLEPFGRRVIEVSGLSSNGLFLPNTPDTVFISENADRAEYQVAFHEALHSFRATNRQGYDRLLSEVAPNLEAYVLRFSNRNRSDQNEVAEEFLADFLADRITDRGFLNKLAAKEPSLFESFVNTMRSILGAWRERFKATKDLGTFNLVEDLDRAENALIEALIELKTGNANPTQTSNPNQRETSSDPGGDTPEAKSRTDELPEFSKNNKFHQAAGTANVFSPKEQANLKEAGETIQEDFPSETLPTTPEGEATARKFLSDLLDKRFVRGLQQRVQEAGFNKDAAIVTGAAARSAFFSYAARLAKEDPARGVPLIYDGLRLTRDLAYEFQLNEDGSLPYQAALFLRALQTFPGGQIVGLFDEESKDRTKFVESKFGGNAGPEIVQIVKALSAKDLSETQAQDLINKLVDEQISDQREQIKQAEERVWAAAEVIVNLFDGGGRLEEPTGQPGGRLEEPTESPLDRVRRLLKARNDVAAMADALTDLANSKTLKDEVGATKAKRVKSAAKKAKIDLLGGSVIRRAARLGDTTPTATDPLVGQFNSLLESDLPLDSFTKRYTSLGGDAKLAPDIHAAQKQLKAAADAKAATAASERALRESERAQDKAAKSFAAVQKRVDSVGERKTDRGPGGGNAPKTDLAQIKKLTDEFASPKTAARSQESLERDLRNLKAPDGSPLMTEAQVQQASARANEARESAKELISQAAELNDLAARIKDAEKTKKAAEKKAEKTASAVETALGKLRGDAPKSSKRVQDTFNSIVGDFLSLRRQRLSFSEMVTELTNLRDAEGSIVLTNNQVNTLAAQALETRRLKIAEQDAAITAQQQDRELRTRQQNEATAQARVSGLIDRRDDALRKIREQAVRARTPQILRDDQPKSNRPKSATQSFDQAVDRFINPRSKNQSASKLLAALTGIKNKDGSRFVSDQQATSVVADAVAARADAESLLAQETELTKTLKKEAQARRLFEAPKARTATTPARSIKKILIEDFINNPLRKVSSREDRIAQAKRILAEKTDLDETSRDRLAEELESEVSKALFDLRSAEAEKLGATLARGTTNLSQEQIEGAVRLEILDPASDMMTNLASLSGWQGLSPRDAATLAEGQRLLDLAPDTRLAQEALRNMARVILKGASVSPQFGEFMNAYFRASIFSAMSSQLTGIVAGPAALAQQLVTESAAAVGSVGKSGFLADLGNVWKEWLGGYVEAFNEARVVATTGGSTFTLQKNVEQERSKSNISRNPQFIDALTRVDDILNRDLPQAWKTLRTKDTTSSQKAKAAKTLLKGVLKLGTLQRHVFTALSAADSAVTKAYQTSQSNILAFRENGKALAKGEGGLTPAQLADLMQVGRRDAEAYVSMLSENKAFESTADPVGMARIVARDRMNQIVFAGLAKAQVPVDTLAAETIADIQGQIGTGDVSGTLLGRVAEKATQGIKNFEDSNIPLASIFMAIRTPSVVADYLAWTVPGVNLPRTLDLFYSSRFNQQRRERVFPNLTADWQVTRRLATAMLSYPLTGLVAAMLLEQADRDEDDRDVWFTGSFPDDPRERTKWAERGWEENSLYLFGLNLKIDRGPGQVLTGPLMIARTLVTVREAEREAARDGKEITTSGIYAKHAFEATRFFVPIVDQTISFGDPIVRETLKASQGNSSAAEVGSTLFGPSLGRLVPLSGLLKTADRQIDGNVDRSQLSPSQKLLIHVPTYVFFDEDNIAWQHNVFGEKLDRNTSADGVIGRLGKIARRIGSPIFWGPADRDADRDPVVVEMSNDFASQNYYGGKVNMRNLKKKFDQADMDFSQDLAINYVKTRLGFVQSQYAPRRDSLLQENSKDFSSKMSALWRKGTQRADRKFGLKPVSR